MTYLFFNSGLGALILSQEVVMCGGCGGCVGVDLVSCCAGAYTPFRFLIAWFRFRGGDEQSFNLL